MPPEMAELRVALRSKGAQVGGLHQGELAAGMGAFESSGGGNASEACNGGREGRTRDGRQHERRNFSSKILGRIFSLSRRDSSFAPFLSALLAQLVRAFD